MKIESIVRKLKSRHLRLLSGQELTSVQGNRVVVRGHELKHTTTQSSNYSYLFNIKKKYNLSI